MCNLFGDSGPSPQELALQQQQMIQGQEDKRQAAIGKGKTAIDSAYSQFDEPYFNNYTKTYTDAQSAPLADQYSTAKDKLTAALAGRDTLESTGGAHAFGQLDKTNEDAQARIGSQAVDATNSLRSNINNSKNSLYAENNAAADPLAAASQAQATAGTIVSPQTASPLSDVFAGVLGPLATAAKTNSSALYPNTSFTAPISGTGSGVFR